MDQLTQVIIVNFNAGPLLTQSVRSVLAAPEDTRILVADNASTDDSVDAVQQRFGQLENVEIHLNADNLGFARAVNAAFRTARGAEAAEYLLILNPDCELLDGALSFLIEALQSDSESALAGPMVVDDHGAVRKATFRQLPDPWRSFVTVTGLWRLGRWFPAFAGVELPSGQLPDVNTQAEAVSGACMLIRRSLFDQLGGMDEAYGLHCEDLDLMQRIRLHGYHSVFVPAARVCHQQGVSSRSRPFWVHRQKHLGMLRYFRKFQADQYLLPVRWLVIAGICLHWAALLPLVKFRS